MQLSLHFRIWYILKITCLRLSYRCLQHSQYPVFFLFSFFGNKTELDVFRVIPSIKFDLDDLLILFNVPIDVLCAKVEWTVFAVFDCDGVELLSILEPLLLFLFKKCFAF